MSNGRGLTANFVPTTRLLMFPCVRGREVKKMVRIELCSRGMADYDDAGNLLQASRNFTPCRAQYQQLGMNS
jgi:hypothetical protein